MWPEAGTPLPADEMCMLDCCVASSSSAIACSLDQLVSALFRIWGLGSVPRPDAPRSAWIRSKISSVEGRSSGSSSRHSPIRSEMACTSACNRVQGFWVLDPTAGAAPIRSEMACLPPHLQCQGLGLLESRTTGLISRFRSRRPAHCNITVSQHALVLILEQLGLCGFWGFSTKWSACWIATAPIAFEP
jgi:hypothetical protein